MRIEIEAALRREISEYSRSELVGLLILTRRRCCQQVVEDLAYRHGTSIRHEHFRGEVDSLIKASL